LPDINVLCFSHVGITVRDLEASLEFYGNLFGSERLFDDVHDDWRRVGLKVGDVRLELFSPLPGRPPRDAPDPYYPMEFGRPKIALTVRTSMRRSRLVANGIRSVCAVVLTPRSKYFFIADPDGTPIHLHEFLGGELRVTDLHRPPGRAPGLVHIGLQINALSCRATRTLGSGRPSTVGNPQMLLLSANLRSSQEEVAQVVGLSLR
jgi:catechol 2,3-dioxygenase-like lactoylglutathione lyase family enzyme